MTHLPSEKLLLRHDLSDFYGWDFFYRMNGVNKKKSKKYNLWNDQKNSKNKS